MNSDKLTLIVVFLFFNLNSNSQTDIDIFKSSMMACDIEWLEEKYNEDTFEVLVDSLPLNHKETIKFKRIDDLTILDNITKTSKYITDLYYKEALVFSKTVAGIENTNLTVYIYVVETTHGNPKNDKHLVQNICGSYYLISYCSIYGIGREIFNKYKCMNSIIKKIQCI